MGGMGRGVGRGMRGMDRGVRGLGLVGDIECEGRGGGGGGGLWAVKVRGFELGYGDGIGSFLNFAFS